MFLADGSEGGSFLRRGECAGYHRQVRKVERVNNSVQVVVDIDRKMAPVPLRFDIPNAMMREWSVWATETIAYGADVAKVKFALEVNARSARFDDGVRRAVGENFNQLGANGQEFE